jgi:hypothetical protein
MNWADLVRPTPPNQRVMVGNRPPTAFDLEELKNEVVASSTMSVKAAHGATWFASDRCYEDELCFSADGREKQRRPGSILDADAARIAAAAPGRRRSDEFAVPSDDPEMEIPSIGLPSLAELEAIMDEDILTDPGLDEGRGQDVIRLVCEFVTAFSKVGRVGKVSTLKSGIRLQQGMNAPAPQPNRPQGPAKREIVHQFIYQMLQWDVIEGSESPTAAAIVLVKKNGKWRFLRGFPSAECGYHWR